MIQADPQNDSERAAVDFLKRFVRGMDQAQLNSFLRWISKTAHHTYLWFCSGVLELPSTYDTFPELREEFTNILAKKMWQNDIM